MAGRFSFQSPGGDSSRPWFRVGQFDVTTTVLVTALGAASMFLWAASPPVGYRFALISDFVLEGQIWRLITWPLANEPTLWFVIGLAIFWYFGSQLEALMGRDRFAWFLGVVTVAPAIVAVLLGIDQAGFRPLQFVVFLVFIAQYPFARFFFGIPAWVLGVVFVGLEVLQLVGLRDTRGLLFLLITLIIAAVTARSFGLLEGLAFIPAVPLPGSRRQRAPRRARRSKRTPRPSRSATAGVIDGPWAPPQAADQDSLQRELDALLDKIAAGGMDSLTSGEKRRLNELSKKLR